MMRLNLVLLPVVAALVGCGDLSQEDLLFRAAIPSKADVEVVPAGAQSQAQTTDGTGAAEQGLEVECPGPHDIKCMARNVGGGLNAITFGLLDIIDFIVRQPPSKRERGRRVWGPFFDNDKGNTARFEMVRNGDGSYDFCVHAVDGRIADRDARDVDCGVDVDSDSGLALVLSGSFAPGSTPGARARTGRGEMELVIARLPEFNGVGRTMEIRFDNREDGTIIDITVTGQRNDFGAGERDPITYTFDRSADGSGTFGFTFFANLNEPDERKPAVERFDMVAKWNSDEAGRGMARASGGDLIDRVNNIEHEVLLDQCWDAALTDTYIFASVTTTGDVLFGPEGDAGQCVFTPEQVEDLLPDLE